MLRLCSVYKLHRFLQKQDRFILIQNVPLHVYHMFQPVLRPSSDMSIQILINKDITKSKGLLVYSHCFLIVLKQNINK